MRRFLHHLRLVFAACLLTACTPARTGVIGNTLTTNVKPAISITGMAPLTVSEHGRLLVESGPPTAEGTASLSFDYAFFTDTEQTKNRFAYAAIVRITNEKQWRFQPPIKFDDAISEGRQIAGGFHWSEQLLRVDSNDDWGSGMWESQNGTPPEFWIAKRWITHLNDKTRAVMEYREPWPDAMRMLSGGTVIVTDEADKALQEFLTRADAAFSVEKKMGEFDGTSPKISSVAPRIPLNVAKTVGTFIRIHDN